MTMTDGANLIFHYKKLCLYLNRLAARRERSPSSLFSRLRPRPSCWQALSLIAGYAAKEVCNNASLAATLAEK